MLQFEINPMVPLEPGIVTNRLKGSCLDYFWRYTYDSFEFLEYQVPVSFSTSGSMVPVADCGRGNARFDLLGYNRVHNSRDSY